jgi:two-component system, NarL family, sensor histidine kinase UhpB
VSLRLTLFLGIVLLVTTSLVCGGVLLYWHAVHKVDTEMNAALTVGERTVRNAVADIERAEVPSQDFAALVKSLDGDRHLRATLVAPHGAILARSAPLESDDPAPEWFYDLLVRPPGVIRVPVPMSSGRAGAIQLETDSRNEIGEAWDDATLTFTILVLFCSMSAMLVHWIVGRALKPLNSIILAFQRVGGGDYGAKALESGPRELAQLSKGFNQMVARLAEMSRRKDRLEEQLVEVQEEERAELARDLHDEIGPLLFAVSVDLVALHDNAAIRADPQLRGRLTATGEAVSRMQQQVRSILGRLRPPTVADIGLRPSVEGLTTFWRTRYPTVSFHLDIVDESFSDDVGSRIYRIVQESINNALRHGHPANISLSVARESATSVAVEISDDGVGLQSTGSHGGLGLTGMRERVTALGGELEVSAGPGGRGVRVRARLPAAAEKELL